MEFFPDMDTKYFPPAPETAKEWFDYAGRLDRNGIEDHARIAYEKAQSLGLENLPEEDRPRFYLQYGSTLRNLAEFDKAQEVLDEGCRLYPDHAALKLFRAFNLCSTGNYKEAATEMMKLAVETGTHPSLAEYKRAIADYIDDIAKPS